MKVFINQKLCKLLVQMLKRSEGMIQNDDLMVKISTPSYSITISYSLTVKKTTQYSYSTQE